VAVDHRLGDAGALGDVLGPGTGISGRQERIASAGQDQTSAIGAGDTLALRRGGLLGDGAPPERRYQDMAPAG